MLLLHAKDFWYQATDGEAELESIQYIRSPSQSRVINPYPVAEQRLFRDEVKSWIGSITIISLDYELSTINKTYTHEENGLRAP